MAKPIMVKCCQCHTLIERNSAYKVGEKSYYCNETCYKNHEDDKKVKVKKSASASDKYKPQKGTSRRELTDFIQELYLQNGYQKKQIPWTLIMSQVKSILGEHQTWSYYTIQYILEYMTNIREMNLFDERYEGSILNLVPYYAIEAEEHWNEAQTIEEAINSFDFTKRSTTIKKDNHKPKTYKKVTFDNM